MLRQKWELATILSILTLGVALGVVLRLRAARPRNVPADAVLVEVGAIRVWQRCTYVEKDDVNRCQVFDVRGDIISDEVFVPYDGGKAAKPEELAVESKTRSRGVRYVCLKNGRMLIARSDFVNQKEYLDRIGAR